MARRSKPQTDLLTNLLTQLGVILQALWRMLRGRRGRRLDWPAIEKRFEEIEILLTKNDSAHASQAVLQADSLFDEVMRKVGARGVTFAERLESLRTHFSSGTYSALWRAHKLRNTIAHEHPRFDTQLAREHVATFRRSANHLAMS